jgi:hypothetical protein
MGVIRMSPCPRERPRSPTLQYRTERANALMTLGFGGVEPARCVGRRSSGQPTSQRRLSRARPPSRVGICRSDPRGATQAVRLGSSLLFRTLRNAGIVERGRSLPPQQCRLQAPLHGARHRVPAGAVSRTRHRHVKASGRRNRGRRPFRARDAGVVEFAVSDGQRPPHGEAILAR